jgi:hypothetical protein
MKLSIKALALALGIAWGVGAFVLALMAMAGWGRPMVELVGSVYLGYAPTPAGAVIGAVWGGVDGAVAGAVIAWLYNRFVR